MNNVGLAFLFTFIAGLSTGIGSLIAFIGKATSRRFLSVALGFSAGVMIYVSMVEILFNARDIISIELGPKPASWISLLSFFGGIALTALIDKVIPSDENPHEVHTIEEIGEPTAARKYRKLHRTGILVALAISMHNFPEGLATFFSTISNPTLGIAIAIAIAIHNIPEGISVSVPIYYATGSRRKAFKYSFLSGLAEPAGAIIGYFILKPFLNEVILGILFAAVAGIMVFISFDELLPAAREYGEHHLSLYGLISGMAVMAISLALLI